MICKITNINTLGVHKGIWYKCVYVRLPHIPCSSQHSTYLSDILAQGCEPITQRGETNKCNAVKISKTIHVGISVDEIILQGLWQEFRPHRISSAAAYTNDIRKQNLIIFWYPAFNGCMSNAWHIIKFQKNNLTVVISSHVDDRGIPHGCPNRKTIYRWCTSVALLSYQKQAGFHLLKKYK